jgi:hypothetical protein
MPGKRVTRQPRLIMMAKRLPRPKQPRRVRCELDEADEAELKAVEDAAHACRLSLAAFIRVVLIEACRHTAEKVPVWKEVAAALAAAATTKPGRPRKPPRRKKKSE